MKEAKKNLPFFIPQFSLGFTTLTSSYSRALILDRTVEKYAGETLTICNFSVHHRYDVDYSDYSDGNVRNAHHNNSPKWFQVWIGLHGTFDDFSSIFFCSTPTKKKRRIEARFSFRTLDKIQFILDPSYWVRRILFTLECSLFYMNE